MILKDEERMSKVDGYLKDARNKADEADKQYDEISKKLQFTEGELEKAEERGENGEMKIMELEEELKVVASNLKSLEVSEEKANKREIANKEQVKTLTAKLKQAVARADFAERSVLKLNMEVGIAEDNQVVKYSNICTGGFLKWKTRWHSPSKNIDSAKNRRWIGWRRS